MIAVITVFEREDPLKKSIENLPIITKNIAVILFIVMLFALGFVDYLTSDYSMVLFYLLYIVGLTWYTSVAYGILGAFMATITEAISDYYTHYDTVFQPIYYWNWRNDLLIFIIICIMVTYIKKHHIIN